MPTGNYQEIKDLLLRITGNEQSDFLLVNENQDFELKASALNKKMRNEMLKAVTGFLNSYHGGVLFIGVGDDKKVIGLEKTEESFTDIDKYEQRLLDILDSKLHDALNRISENIRFHFFRLEAKIICALEVTAFFPTANEPLAFCEFQNSDTGDTKKIFFKRSSGRTKTMTAYDVAMDMLHRRRGQLSDPSAPGKDSEQEGKPYKVFDDIFTLLNVIPNVQAPNGKMRTELILQQRDGITVTKFRNEDWKRTAKFVSDANHLIGRQVKLAAWKDKSRGDDYWWEKNFVANIYPVNLSTPLK